ncbi:Pyrophosphate-energized proton pump [Gemmatirosa kalamazoonensis]|uniref:K(+)-insensitive pyrophosphate-energized proton pump n=1 Tax=Gemmatirosa kalamazoonensis TaxID=861299 RepID=W0RLE5_9BACT|nr:sodium-translocating pyrophosphatase [Gemmatirosa kalamazoonensis]AHG91150.1 Pyrophosphate-energized proton pump [Gemmatirosa kalamazoonensis]
MAPSQSALLWLILGASGVALVVAVLISRGVLARDRGTAAMQRISNAIQEGAEAYLARQYKTIGLLAVVVAALIYVGYAFAHRAESADSVGGLSAGTYALYTTVAFLLGAICSGIAGFMGMWVSIRTNIRTAAAATTSLNAALQTALRGGAVSGLFTVAMSIIGVAGLFGILQLLAPAGVDPAAWAQRIPFLIVGFGFGASFVALFAQLGGGIYTKAADVGADLVGKVEAGIPEDDPRNPAVIADLVGDNVGDCAGRGADLFESTAAENIGAMVLGVLLYRFFGLGGVLFPLVVGAVGLLASIVGVMIVRTSGDEDPMSALNRGFYATSALVAVGFFGLSKWLLQTPDAPDAWWHYFLCGMIGLATAFAFVYITQYYTEYRYRPVKSIAEASQTGAATNIIAGIAVGMESTVLPVITVAVAIISSYYLGRTSGLLDPTTGQPVGGLFGTAVATMGMLGTAGYILAMDVFGPITDNAGGIVEMSEQPDSIREKTDRLDAVGNTTKALTKGYAIGSAALAAFLLFSAYLDEVRTLTGNELSVNLAKPQIFVAGLLGAMLVFWFSSLAMSAVRKAAQSVIEEVRRQFREKPGIMQGTDQPDYGRCVDIVTIGALKAMVFPGALVVVFPIAVGLVFKQFGLGAEAVAAFLMIGTIAGILMAGFLNNGGGAWDNAKKYIETGMYGGKRSDAHKAAVVGDTVGDPFKDTAGPSLHVFVKLLSTITLVLAPLFI